MCDSCCFHCHCARCTVRRTTLFAMVGFHLSQSLDRHFFLVLGLDKRNAGQSRCDVTCTGFNANLRVGFEVQPAAFSWPLRQYYCTLLIRDATSISFSLRAACTSGISFRPCL
jgi:hypothetical protein